MSILSKFSLEGRVAIVTQVFQKGIDFNNVSYVLL